MAARFRAVGAALISTAVGVIGGCGGGTPEKPAVALAPEPAAASAPATPAASPFVVPDPGQAAPTPAAAAPAFVVPLDPRLHQPWEAAVVGDDVPEGGLPPEKTMTGKSVGKLNDLVSSPATWDDILFELPTGKAVRWQATVQTKQGTFVIDLRPELAPNHVRNFIALARLGYYDGLVFEQASHEQPTSGPAVDLLKGGCPLGIGDEAISHLGYFLKPEFADSVGHEEGTVGAWHGEDPNSACCRFYVTLGPVPGMNGRYSVFGKVSSGLDVLRTIHQQPGDGDRPTSPVVIEKVTVTSQEVERPAAVTKN